jgi:NADH-quinone oxidoreductase subunit L
MNGPLYLWLIPLLPFAGFLINGILGRRLPKSLVTVVGLLAPCASFIFVAHDALMAWSGGIKLPATEAAGAAWITAGHFHVDFGTVLDPLSLVMLLVVTGVGFVIHIYSVGYMRDDPGYARYFSYLNLFLFFMTVLVEAGNVLLMFVGWEGVGLASYLLIGFWYQKNSAADAGKKAFIVNRIGDFGFLIGIFLLLAQFGSLKFADISAQLTANPALQGGIITAIAICLLVGATGKSAQLPLYVWLPDAMEGPTPVSALIHAATMVTAGVYMIARTHFLFDRSPVAMMVVAVVGAATAFFAATIGLVQNDIKRVLAYSTISQLGYMFLGCGVAAYSAAIFHLMTHAFFKALLFLAAGSVIHGLGGEQDMRRMGGLKRYMPVTYWTMSIAVLAISGFPPLAAFFSKDAILNAAFVAGGAGKVFWFVGLVTALLTSFYMFRLWYMTFQGERRGETIEEHGAPVHARSHTKLTMEAHGGAGHGGSGAIALEAQHEHEPHESPWSMLGPLVVLAILSVIGGWIGAGRFGAYLAPSVGTHTAEALSSTWEWTLTGLAVLMAALGWLIADRLYRTRPEMPARLAGSLSGLYKLLFNKYWVDELYQAVIIKPLLALSRFFLEWVVDVAILDGAVWLLGGICTLGGAILQRWQSGNLRSYAAWLAAAAAVVLIYVLWTYSPTAASLFFTHGAGH